MPGLARIDSNDDGPTIGPAYDDAPRGISLREARAIAGDEYGYKPSRDGWIVVHRGADGGWHFNDHAYSEAAARGACAEKQRKLVRRLMAGDCTHTCFYDRHRDRFYSA